MKVTSVSINYEGDTGDRLYIIAQEDLVHFETWSNGYKHCVDMPTDRNISMRDIEVALCELNISGFDLVEIYNFIYYSGFNRDEY
ncbi:hypothetical protein AC4_112 [Acinetobacter phage AC4]|nr:hypothetical protein AC4_112 [Acinetobacter phage AC4]